MSADSERQVLAERARKLSQPAIKLDLDVANERLLVFERSGARYALDTRFVLEVLSVAAHAELPFMPDYCLGLAVARGELLSLFNLAVLLGEPRSAAPPRSMLLCGETRPELGLVIDRALTLSDLRPLLAAPSGASTLIAGVHPDGFAVIDGAALFSDPRLTIGQATQEKSP